MLVKSTSSRKSVSNIIQHSFTNSFEQWKCTLCMLGILYYTISFYFQISFYIQSFTFTLGSKHVGSIPSEMM